MMEERPREPAIATCKEEWRTIRDAMRQLNAMIVQLSSGTPEKYVLTSGNRMRAVLLTVEDYAMLTERGRRAEVLRDALDQIAAKGDGYFAEADPEMTLGDWCNSFVEIARTALSEAE